MCGSLVESGADPTLAVEAVVDRLPAVLAGAAVALERLGEGDDPEALFAAEPEAVNAWKALRYLVLPAMAMLAHDAAARQRARARPELRDALKVIAPHETVARFLAMTLDLADGLELLVIHPRQGKGFRVNLEAVAGNAHLFTLLQGTLIGSPKAGLLEGPPPSVEVVGVATGQIVPERHVSDKALFHYYDWSALDADPESDELHLSATVWVDGRPEEIPEFEGTRVLLLGRPVFGFRGWDSTHFPLFHDALRPRVRVLGSLTPDEVTDWLSRMREAVRAAGV